MIKLHIEGMTCGHCVMHVKRALLGVSGVEAADVDLQTQQAIVRGQADALALVAAVEAEGYSARLA